MRILCLIKFVPDTDNFVYDYERNILVRENMDLILNPDDACALAWALKFKKTRPDMVIEVLTMAPLTILEQIRDLLRINIDQVTLISDRSYRGSDTYATARILAQYISRTSYDVILTGTHSLDGDTAHIPSQLACLLGDLPQISGVYQIKELIPEEKAAVVETEDEDMVYTYRVELPGVISMIRNTAYKLPFVRYEDLDRNVDDNIRILTNRELELPPNETGIGGSLTRVTRTYPKTLPYKEKLLFSGVDAGVEGVYDFLESHHFV